jgi:hypothetical protein
MFDDDEKYKNVDFSKLGFNDFEVNDLQILMSLKTPKQFREWSMTVGVDDTCYGFALLECAALAMLDHETRDMGTFPDAMNVIDVIRNKNA